MTNECTNFSCYNPSLLKYPIVNTGNNYATVSSVVTTTAMPTTISSAVVRRSPENRSSSYNELTKTNFEVSNADTVWYDKCVNLVNKIIKYYRTNDISDMSPLMIHFMNTIRDMCIETNPVHVNVVKRFENEEMLIRHYMRLQRDLSTTNAAESLTSDHIIFQPSFILNSLPAYAQKFYNNGKESLGKDSLNEAAKQLSVAVEYMVAEAVTNNIPIPLPFNQQLANNYMVLLLKHANVPENIQNAVESRRFPHINMINDLINNVIDDLFAGGGDYYYYVLNETNRARVISLKENLGFLAPLSASADIFNYIAELATRAGKRPSQFQSATFLTSAANAVNSPGVYASKTAYQDSLTQLAFENEALRRFIFQQLNYQKLNTQ
ncbi:GP41 [Parapoynx stagnalis nucleopolyhedrovirus]|uniref:GP41 n=1 Tax=Parapoynx stagnalis nucleopolyhedrovirus TaxID=2993413 RepID=A0A9E7YC40_9ABAC|nr:GP41 [Parapoynx stagnalis nucleopolyhedrovirus]